MTTNEAKTKLPTVIVSTPRTGSAAPTCANCNSPAKHKCSECGKMFCDDCCALDADREVTVCTNCFCKPPNAPAEPSRNEDARNQNDNQINRDAVNSRDSASWQQRGVRPMQLETMTKDERSLLLFLESRATDQAGRVKTVHMNEADMKIAERWNREGFVKFGRIASGTVKEWRAVAYYFRHKLDDLHNRTQSIHGTLAALDLGERMRTAAMVEVSAWLKAAKRGHQARRREPTITYA